MRVLLLLATPAIALSATLESAYYAPDRGTPYTWFEGAKEIESYFDKDYRAAGYLCAYIRNDGDRDIEATEFTLDGAPLSDLREEHEVIWWRLLPRPLPPRAVGEILVRLRDPLTEPRELRVAFSDGSSIAARITPQPNPLRIETIGFNQAMDRVFLVAESLDDRPRELSEILLDGVDITRNSRLLAPAFVQRVSPVSIHLNDALTPGSYHIYTVRAKTGETASCCIRTNDGWVPLGSYGHATFDEFARNGCNGHNNFGRASNAQLDTHQRLGMRQVSMLGDAQVADYERDHPGLLAHCLMDEPDCADYGIDDRPHPVRVGYHAMEMEKRAQNVRAGNPTKPSLLTLDLTYKPANYYIYGPIADIANPDCYPVSPGRDLKQVREVVETARLGAGPRPLTFTFEGVMMGPRDPEAFDKKRFPRPNFPAEQRIMMYYAVGAGARGLFNYIHCTENSATRWSRGSTEFPEVWNEIGQVYRELDHVAPLLALAHPTKLATSDAPRLWLRALLCGENTALVCIVNENYEQRRMSLRYAPLRDVRITLPDLPWLAGARAYAVGAEGFTNLESEEGEVLLPRVDVAGIILVTTDADLPERLAARYESRKQIVGARLLDEWRRDLAEEAAQRTALRLITGEFAEFAVTGSAVAAYHISASGFWNPEKTEHNAFEFGQNERKEDQPRGAEYRVSIPKDRAGEPHILYAICGTWGRPGTLVIADPAGKTLAEMSVSGGTSGRLRRLRFVPPEAGEHTVSFMQPGPGPKGGRASHVIYIVPESELFDASLLDTAR